MAKRTHFNWMGRMAAALLGACTALTLLSVPAYAENRVISAPTQADGTTMTVSDDVTRIYVNKLDKDTHEFVTGATLQIVRQDTGEVIDEWVTSAETHQVVKALDVNVVYVLREAAAPDGYDVVGDTVFVPNEVEGTGITIISADDDTELSEAYKVTLYDQLEVTYKDTTKVVRRTTAPNTGDSSPVVLVAGLAVAGMAGLVVLRKVRRGER